MAVARAAAPAIRDLLVTTCAFGRSTLPKQLDRVLGITELEANQGSLLVPREITNEIVQYAADLDQAVKLVFGVDAFTRT